MQCEQCDREATVYELRVVNGKKHERHLCEQCAREAGIAVPAPVSVPELIQQMVQGVAAAKPAAPAAGKCPGCGMSYEEFRQLGQLGCPQCYQAFEAQLGPLLERWHEGGSHHVGKTPRRGFSGRPSGQLQSSGVPDQGARLETLQRQLEEAVRTEQYERAAKLRDEIRRLKEGAAGRIGQERP